MDQIDNYKIVEKIGEGGMGEVYKGVDVMLEREVAIKLLRPELSSRDDIVQRFRSEAIALGRLNHPNIAAVYNFGRIRDQFYMALEFVNGETLDSVIKKEGSLTWQTAVQYAIAILEGLDHAHKFNIVHRDIKPSNVIITGQNTVKILDFGIARILEKARLTKTGHLIGTLEYVSPEQIQGKETDARSDIYSVGVVLYEMLTGHIPFEKNTEYDLIKSQIEEKPKSPRTFSSKIPAQIEQLALKALEKKPEKRFSSAREFSKELLKLLDGAEIKVPLNSSDSESGGIIKFCRDYPGIVFLFFLLAIGGGYFLWILKSTPNSQLPPVSTVISPNPVASSHKEIIPIIETDKKEGRSDLLPSSPIENLPPLTVEIPEQQTKSEPAPKPRPKPALKPRPRPKPAPEQGDPGIDDAAKSFFR